MRQKMEMQQIGYTSITFLDCHVFCCIQKYLDPVNVLDLKIFSPDKLKNWLTEKQMDKISTFHVTDRSASLLSSCAVIQSSTFHNHNIWQTSSQTRQCCAIYNIQSWPFIGIASVRDDEWTGRVLGCIKSPLHKSTFDPTSILKKVDVLSVLNVTEMCDID